MAHRKNISASEYLEIVLNDWSSFCEAHSRFTESLAELLEENKRLNRELEKYKQSEVTKC